MIQLITMLGLLSAVFCQHSRQRSPTSSHNEYSQRYDQPPYEENYVFSTPQLRKPTYYKPAPVHYVNIGAELAGDYKFGYDTGKAENGQSFREETRLPDGTVQGSYGYVDETGKQRIVKYIAGKDGFKVVKDPQANSSPEIKSNSQSRQSSRYSQPEVHQAATYRRQQANTQSRQRPAQKVTKPQSSRLTYGSRQRSVQNSERRNAPEPQQYAAETERYAPEPQQYAAEAERYAPEPQDNAPEPETYVPEPQNYAPEPQRYASEPQNYVSRSSRSRSRSRYVSSSTYQNDDESYDYPNKEFTNRRRIVPIDTSLLSYNIGTSSKAHVFT